MTVRTFNARPPADAATHILQVACQLFSQHGYKAVGMRCLAEHVGVRPGSLYYHIESKQSLLYELIESYENEYLHVIRAVARKPMSSLRELADELWVAMTQFIAQHPGPARLTHNEAPNLSAGQGERIHAIRRMRDIELRRLLIINQVLRPDAAESGDAVQVLTGILDYVASLSTTTVSGSRHLIESQLKELLAKTLHSLKALHCGTKLLSRSK